MGERAGLRHVCWRTTERTTRNMFPALDVDTQLHHTAASVFHLFINLAQSPHVAGFRGTQADQDKLPDLLELTSWCEKRTTDG